MPVPVNLGQNIGMFQPPPQKPLANVMGEGLGLARGIGQVQDEQLARQQAAQLKQVWDATMQKHGGNLDAVFSDQDLLGVLGPENVLKLREATATRGLREDIAMMNAQAKIDAASRTAESRETVASIQGAARVDASVIGADAKRFTSKLGAESRRDVAKIGAGARIGAAREGTTGRVAAAKIAAIARREVADIGAEARRDVADIMAASGEKRTEAIAGARRYSAELSSNASMYGDDTAADIRRYTVDLNAEIDREEMQWKGSQSELGRQEARRSQTQDIGWKREALGTNIDATRQNLEYKLRSVSDNLEKKMKFEGDENMLARAAREGNLLEQIGATATQNFLSREQKEKLFYAGLDDAWKQTQAKFDQATSLVDRREAYLDASFLRDSGLKTSILELENQYKKEREAFKRSLADGSEPPKRYRRVEGRDLITEEWDTEAGEYTEISRGPRSTTAFIGADAMNDPTVVAMAESIYKGRVPADYPTKRSNFRAAIVQYLAQNHPDFDLTKLIGQSNAEKNVLLNRSMAVLRSITEPQGGELALIDQLVAAHKEIGFTRFPAANWGLRQFLTQTGDERVLGYDNLRNNLAQELGNALGMAAITDSRLKMELENLPKNPSYEQILRVAKVTKDIVAARLKAIEGIQGQAGAEQGAGQTGRYRILNVQEAPSGNP